MLEQPFLSVKNARKTYGRACVLNGISFELAAGQTLAILGRSGCGKTTLLKWLAGLLEGDGAVYLSGKNLAHTPPQQRGIVYLYQEALLFPHLNVFDNVAFGLKIRHWPKNEIKTQTAQMLEYLGLSELADEMSDALSGGQKQRVAFGRALIIKPQLLLLDEPFGALDVETRAQMQDFYQKMAAAQGITAVFVTHDLREAIRMGQRWGYMQEGQLQIFDTLEAFTNDPRTGVKNEIDFWKNIHLLHGTSK